MKIALFPGSFDPITIAHTDILQRALPLFDKVYIGIGLNSAKQGFLDFETRLSIVQSIYKNTPNVIVESFSGLTVDYCKKIHANYMIRGIRSVADFEYEKSIAQINHTMMPEVESIIILSKPEYSSISSTIVRDILRNGGDVSAFVPPEAMPYL